MKPNISMLNKLFAPAVLLAFAPSLFGQLTVNPTSLQFASGGVTSQNVFVTAPSNATVALTPSITYSFTNPSSAAWLSVASGTTNQALAVTVNTAPGGSPLPNGQYNANLQFSSTAGSSNTLPVTLSITGSAGGGTTTVATPSVINLSNLSPSATLTLNATSVSQSYSINNPVSWLSLSSIGGVTSPNVSTFITVTAVTSLLTTSASTNITVTVGSQSQVIQVNYTPSGTGGTNTGLTLLSPTSLNYAVPVATTNDASLVQSFANQFQFATSISQYVELRVTTSANTGQGTPFLAVTPNNTTTTAGVPVNIGTFIDPRGLAAGSYSGTIGIYQGGTFNLLGTVAVNLVVGSSVSPSSFTITAPYPATTPEIRQLTVNVANKLVTLSAITDNGFGWLSVPPFSAVVSSTYTTNVNINPTGLAPGTYSGRVRVSIQGQADTDVPVSLIVGSGTGSGGVISPNPLSLSAALGSAATGSITLSPGTATNYSITTNSAPFSLTFTPQNGTIAAGSSAFITVTAGAGGLSSGTYAGTYTVTFNNATQQVGTVNLTVGSGGGTGGAVSPSTLTFSTDFINSQTQTIAITGATNTVYSISSSVPWLTASPNSGVLTFGSQSVSVTANPTGYGAGTYSGVLTVNVGGINYTVTATMTVGGGGGGVGTGTVTPTTLNFNAAIGGPAQQQQVTLTGTAGTQYSIAIPAAAQTWLSSSLIAGTMPSTTLPITFTVTPGVLQPGSYSATVPISVSGIQSSVNVFLTVGSGGVSPSSLTFTTPVGTAPAPQTLQISTSSSATYTVAPTVSWLSVSPSSGVVNNGAPVQVVVNVVTANLPATAGTYTGNINVGITGQNNVSIPVTVNYGTSGGSGLLSPSSLTFNYTPGGSVPNAQTVTVSSPTGQNLTFNVDFPSVAWLSISPSAATAPGSFNVFVNQNSLPTSSTSTTLTVRYANGQTATIPVNLSIGGSGGVSSLNQVLSHIADSAGWQTTITLVNLDPSPANFSLRFYGSQTTGRSPSTPLEMAFSGLAGRTSLVEGTIPANGSRRIQTAGTDAVLNMGWAELTTSNNIAATAVFRDIAGRQEAAVSLTRGVRAFVLPFDNTNGRTTSFALINTNPSLPITVTATVRDESGVVLGTSTISLQARGHIATETTRQFTASNNQRGAVEFSTANADISGLGLRFDAGVAGAPLPFTSFPVTPRP